MKKEKTAIIFTGDIGFDRYMANKWEDKELLSKSILDFFGSADHTVANVEGAVMDIVNDGSLGAYFHTMDPKATKVLNEINADIWNIGNNHIMDAKKEGLISTRKIAAQNGAVTIGAGLNNLEASEPVYLDEAGGIGLFCTSYISQKTLQKNGRAATETTPGIFRWDDYELIAKRIAQVKAKCRWCIIVCHGGEEFACMPSPYTRERYLKYLELGADVVVSHHPHVPENYELFDNGKAIFYSLGNFIFDTDYQRAHKYTDVGVLLKLIFTEEKMDFEAMGVRVMRGEQRIVETPLPAIFENVTAEEYDRLMPLALKAFIAEEKRRMIFLEPDNYAVDTQDVWEEYFLRTEPEGYFPNEHMDFSCLIPIADKFEDGEWKKCALEKVKQYMLSLL